MRNRHHGSLAMSLMSIRPQRSTYSVRPGGWILSNSKTGLLCSHLSKASSRFSGRSASACFFTLSTPLPSSHTPLHILNTGLPFREDQDCYCHNLLSTCHENGQIVHVFGMGIYFATYHIEPAMVRMNTSLHIGGKLKIQLGGICYVTSS